MPSLFRFIVLAGLLAGAGYGGLYVLSEFMEPESKEIAKLVPGVKIRR